MTATFETSRAAWRFLIDSGVCTKRQQVAWDGLYDFGPATAMELCEKVKTSGLWKRLSELRSLGLVEERPARQCRITGRRSTVWCAMPAGSVKRIEEPKARTFWLVKSVREELHRVFYSRPWDPSLPGDDVIEVREVRR